jgi:hypothetical protein
VVRWYMPGVVDSLLWIIMPRQSVGERLVLISK